jgi:hypothetical protein
MFCSGLRGVLIIGRCAMHMRLRTLVLFGIMFLSTRIFAQAELQRFDRQLEQIRREQTAVADNVPLEQRALFEYGAIFGFNYFSLDDPSGRSHGLRQFDVFPFARLNLDGANEFYLRGRWGYRDWNRGESLDGRGDEPIDGDLDRGFYRFDYRAYQNVHRRRDPGFDFAVKGGRDLAYWGNGLTLSQVLDGVVVNAGWGGMDLEVLAGVTPTRTTDIDFSRPNFDHNTSRGFYGAMLSKQIERHRPYIYALAQQDYNVDNVGVISGITTVYDYNSWYVGTGVSGSITDRLLYGVEVTYEGGSTLSNSFIATPQGLQQIPQTEDRIGAYAADVRLDYLLNDARRTRFTFETIAASGDSDRLLSSTNTFGGNRPNTSDRAFNAFGLLNTGLAFGPQASNVLIFRLGAVTFPLPNYHVLRRFQVGTDVFLYNKLASNGPIDEPSTDGRYLGFEPDFFINWEITSDVTVSFRYGLFFPGEALSDLSDSTRQFISAGVTYAF